PDLMSLSSGGLQGLQAGNNVVVLRLRAEAIRAIRARVALVALRAVSAGGALGALRPVLAVSARRPARPLRPLRTRRSLGTLLAPRRLSGTSRLDPIQLISRNRSATIGPIGPLIRLKSHQLPPGKVELPGKLDAPGVSLPPQRPRRRP